MFISQFDKIQKFQKLSLGKVYFIQIMTILVFFGMFLMAKYDLFDLEQWLFSTVIAGIIFLILRFLFKEIPLYVVIIISVMIVIFLDILTPLYSHSELKYEFGDLIASIPVIFALSWVETLVEEGVEEVRDDLERKD